MGRNSSRRAAEQMQRDGISKLPKWSKPVRSGCADIQTKNQMPMCECAGCGKRASYATPKGNACFGHAIKQASIPDRTDPQKQHWMKEGVL